MNKELVSSLVAKYRAAFREEHYGGIWKGIFDRYQRPLHDVLMRCSPEEAEEILANPLGNFLHFGFENTFKGTSGRLLKDTSLLRRLSIALGAEPAPNPDQENATIRLRLGMKRRRARESAEDILKRIDSTLGLGIEFPNVFHGEDGFITPRGIASHRAINAIYQASLLRGRVLEIGGGLGRTAFYAHRFGVTDYTIVDLPFTGISQGYFLGRALGAHGVKLLSPDEFFDSAETYDVALNADSLPEMSRAMAERYATAITHRAKRFISINHESNAFLVRDLFAGRISRHPYWLREGYVEEAFSCNTRQR
jgi:hypothetical protein